MTCIFLLCNTYQVSANVEVRRGIMRKQQSLPISEDARQQQQTKSVGSSLKERLQQLRSGWQRISSAGSKEGGGSKDENDENEKDHGGEEEL